MRRVKLPKMFRLPRMQPWHLFDEARLREIERAAESRYLRKANPPMEQVPRDKKEREAPGRGAARPPQAQRRDGGGEGPAEAFPAWTRRDMMEMVAGMRHGGAGQAAVHGEMLKRGATGRWRRLRGTPRGSGPGAAADPGLCQAGGARRARGAKAGGATEPRGVARRFVSRYPVPWEQIRLRYASGQQKDWRRAQDRFVLCWTVQNGFGRWDELQRAIRGTADFAFDYLFRTRTPEELEKRCRMLLRMCAKLCGTRRRAASGRSTLSSRAQRTGKKTWTRRSWARRRPPTAASGGCRTPRCRRWPP